MIKVDLEKAYDRLSWKKHCIETVRMSIIWNGIKLNWCRPTRGIRQGDPMSPYLFVLCMERLGHAINKLVTKGLWKPITHSKHGPLFSHLFFADDLLLFAEATEEHIKIILDCFDSFYYFRSKSEFEQIQHSILH